MTETLRALKARSELRLEGEKKVIDRKRNLLTLVARYLQNNGYLESALQVQNEAGISLSRYDAADNIDLLGMMIDYEDAYRIKFGRSVTLVRKVTDGSTSSKTSKATVAQQRLRKEEARKRRDDRNNYTGHVGRGGIDGQTSTALAGKTNSAYHPRPPSLVSSSTTTPFDTTHNTNTSTSTSSNTTTTNNSSSNNSSSNNDNRTNSSSSSSTSTQPEFRGRSGSFSGKSTNAAVDAVLAANAKTAQEPTDDEFSNWCGWHNDHGSLTALCPAMYFQHQDNGSVVQLEKSPDPTAGLYIRARDGSLHHVKAPSTSHLLFQIGETSQIHSGGILQATPHAVKGVSVPNVCRSTFACFMEPGWAERMDAPADRTPEVAQSSTAELALPKGVSPLKARWGSKQCPFTTCNFGAFTSATLGALH